MAKIKNSSAIFNVDSWQKIGKTEPNKQQLKDWEQSSNYSANDIVVYNNNIYRAKVDISNEIFSDEKWQRITDNGLFAWTSNKQYYVGDIVVYNNDLYRANIDNKDNEFVNTKWDNVTYNSRSIISTWIPNCNYVQNQIVVHDGDIYRAKNDVNKSLFDAEDFERLSSESSFDSIVNWEANKTYKQKSIVVYKNSIYRANEDVTSQTFDESKWTKLVDVKTFSVWKEEQYKKNDIVVYKNDIYIANKNIDSNTFNNEDWVKITNRIAPNIQDWKDNFVYKQNDIVVYNGNVYRAKFDTNKTVFAVADWDILTQNGMVKVSLWDANKEYIQGEIVKSKHSDIFYLANKSHTSNTDINEDIVNQNLIGLITVEDFNGRAYSFGEIVRYNKQLYRAKTTIRAKSNFNINEWDELNHTFAVQDWEANTTFVKDTFIIINDITYQVKYNLTSGETFSSEFTYVKPQYASIAEWKQNANYAKGITVIYDEALYQCIASHTSETLFAKENWKLVAAFSNTTIIEDFDVNKNYRSGEMVYYNNRLYRAPFAIAKANTFQSDWVLVNNGSFAQDWISGKQYYKNEVVFYAGKLFRAKKDTQSNYFKEEEWESLFQAVLMSDWKQNVFYEKGDIIVHNGQIWRAGSKHTSSLEFDANKWESLSGGGVGSAAGWKQITKLNVSSGEKVRIQFPETLTFCLPPIDVLQLVPGASNVILNQYTFDNVDNNRFNYNEGKVIFDGKSRCNTEYNIVMTTPQPLGNGFISISNEIDFNDYNNIDDIYVI